MPWTVELDNNLISSRLTLRRRLFERTNFNVLLLAGLRAAWTRRRRFLPFSDDADRTRRDESKTATMEALRR